MYVKHNTHVYAYVIQAKRLYYKESKGNVGKRKAGKAIQDKGLKSYKHAAK
jgi:hypothetical protein